MTMLVAGSTHPQGSHSASHPVRSTTEGAQPFRSVRWSKCSVCGPPAPLSSSALTLAPARHADQTRRAFLSPSNAWCHPVPRFLDAWSPSVPCLLKWVPARRPSLDSSTMLTHEDARGLSSEDAKETRTILRPWKSVKGHAVVRSIKTLISLSTMGHYDCHTIMFYVILKGQVVGGS